MKLPSTVIVVTEFGTKRQDMLVYKYSEITKFSYQNIN